MQKGRTLRKLLNLLKSLEVQLNICFLPNPKVRGVYLNVSKAVLIDKRLSDRRRNIILLHEIGHILDDRLLSKKDLQRIDKAYMAYNAHRHTTSQEDVIYETEKRAWHYGETVARLLKIKLPSGFHREKWRCLASYKNSF